MPKINSVLLIDDNASTNFLHTRILRNSKLVDTIHSVTGARTGLDYLTTELEGAYPKPELIFLDINMPGMNGWEFLDAYRDLPETQRGGIVIVMLTTSLNPDDYNRAKTIAEINDFQPKPLTVAAMEELVEKHFDNL